MPDGHDYLDATKRRAEFAYSHYQTAMGVVGVYAPPWAALVDEQRAVWFATIYALDADTTGLDKRPLAK
jgi:hypothetical protein